MTEDFQNIPMYSSDFDEYLDETSDAFKNFSEICRVRKDEKSLEIMVMIK